MIKTQLRNNDVKPFTKCACIPRRCGPASCFRAQLCSQLPYRIGLLRAKGLIRIDILLKEEKNTNMNLAPDNSLSGYSIDLTGFAGLPKISARKEKE